MTDALAALIEKCNGATTVRTNPENGDIEHYLYTAEEIKEGCKKALDEASDDLDKAWSNIRLKGLQAF